MEENTAQLNSQYVLSTSLKLPVHKWKFSVLNGTWVFQTTEDVSWWFRFWTKFFFNGKWKKL